MKIDIVTLFPSMFEGPFRESIIARGIERGLLEINFIDLRKYGIGKHQQVDDRPYGGGVGMLLMVEPIFNALQDIKTPESKVIMMTPSKNIFNQAKARELAEEKHIILLSGRYEGFDERVREHLIDEELSIGNYVLTGGELPAMVVAETVARLVPGVLNKEEATQKESFAEGDEVEHPHYTHPAEFNGWKVPEILLSGHHAEIEKWKKEKSEERSK